jgi:hypothetical protein
MMLHPGLMDGRTERNRLATYNRSSADLQSSHSHVIGEFSPWPFLFLEKA